MNFWNELNKVKNKAVAVLEIKSFGFETASPYFGFSDVSVITDSSYKIFLCGGNRKHIEYQTCCALAFIVEVGRRRKKTHKCIKME